MRYSPNQKYNLAELLGKADAGDLDAMGTAVCLLTAEYDHADDPELEARIFRYLETLVQNGESFANIMLADYYVRGRIAEQDIEKALSLYEAAVENRILFGNESLGMLYFEGLYVPQDFRKAFQYFKKSGKEKSPCTLYALGELYRLGLYVRQNESKAVHYYREIVTKKYAECDDYYWRACYRIGCALRHGIGTEQDTNEAYRLLTTAKDRYNKNDHDPFPISENEVFTEWVSVGHEIGLL